MRIPLKTFATFLVVCAALATLALGGRTLRAAPDNLHAPNSQQAMNNSVCANYKPPKGLAKFTGRIQAAPSGTSFELNAGNENAVVSYTASTNICQGGQSTTAEALIPGKNATVYGEQNRSGKSYRVAASMIVVEGAAASAQRMTSNTPRTNTNTNSGPPAQNNPDSAGSSPIPTNMNLQQNLRNPNASGISCQSMAFSISGGTSIGAAAGRGGARTEVDGLICVRPVDQESMQLVTDSVRAEHMPSVTLT